MDHSIDVHVLKEIREWYQHQLKNKDTGTGYYLTKRINQINMLLSLKISGFHFQNFQSTRPGSWGWFYSHCTLTLAPVVILTRLFECANREL